MRLSLVIGGFVVSLFGVVFLLQGAGAIGPTSSFMFEDKQWIYAGTLIFLVGDALALVGLTRPDKSQR